jgi:hypothetical protein
MRELRKKKLLPEVCNQVAPVRFYSSQSDKTSLEPAFGINTEKLSCSASVNVEVYCFVRWKGSWVLIREEQCSRKKTNMALQRKQVRKM